MAEKYRAETAKEFARDLFKILKPYVKKVGLTGELAEPNLYVTKIELVILPDRHKLEKFFLDKGWDVKTGGVYEGIESHYTEKYGHWMPLLKWDRKLHQVRFRGHYINLWMAYSEKDFDKVTHENSVEYRKQKRKTKEQ